MKKLIILFLLIPSIGFCSPSNSISIPNSFSPNTTISSSEMNANFNEGQTKYNVHTHTDITQVGAITSGTWTGTVIDTAYGGTGNANGIGLPTGAIFFMITGSCPTGSTDVSTTYSNKFVRINATAASTGGTDTHTHAAGTYAGPSHTHSVPYSGWSTTSKVGNSTDLDTGKGSEASDITTANNTSGAGGTGAVTGTSASADNVPAYVTMKACQVD